MTLTRKEEALAAKIQAATQQPVGQVELLAGFDGPHWVVPVDVVEFYAEYRAAFGITSEYAGQIWIEATLKPMALPVADKNVQVVHGGGGIIKLRVTSLHYENRAHA